MKANEFVKKFGWDVAKEIRKGAVLSWYVPQANIQLEFHEIDFSYNDLKRLVESHELVEKRGGLVKAKVTLIGMSDLLKQRPVMPMLHNQFIRLKQAIADVESCQ